MIVRATNKNKEVFKLLHLGVWLDGAAEPEFDLAVWNEGKDTFDLVDLKGCKAWSTPDDCKALTGKP